MKNLFYFFLLAVVLSACSLSFVDIPSDKMGYVKSAIVCDCKTNNYVVINQEDLVEYFNGDIDVVEIKYEYSKSKNVPLKRSIRMAWAENKDGVVFHRVEFDRYSFPMSACRKLKTEPKYFK